MSSIHNKGKPVLAERFIKTLKTKIYEYTKHSNDKDSEFKVDDHEWISKYKNIFAKRYKPNWSEEVFVIKRIKNILPWTCY